jgi:hypothetical protein
MKRLFILLFLIVSVSLSALGFGRFTYGIRPAVAYGGMTFVDSTVTITATQDTWAWITNADNDLFTGISTADGVTVSGDTLTFANAGIYFFNYSLSFSGNNGETWKIRTLVNDTDGYGGTTRYTSNNDTGNVSAGCIIDVSADDYLIMQIMNQTDNDDPTVKSGQIKTFRIK